MSFRGRATLVVHAGLALAAACSKEKAPGSVGVTVAPPVPRAVQTDSALTNYVEWNRDWMLLASRHKGELDAEMPGITARHPFRSSYKVTQDTQLLAMLERQRSEMQRHMARAPRGMTAEALAATLSGLGHSVIEPSGMIWVPGRNESALTAARARYGDAFVAWVLAHERVIVSTLAHASPAQ